MEEDRYSGGIYLPLLQIEQVSRDYARTFGIHRDAAYFMLKLQEKLGELTQAFMLLHKMGRQKGKSVEELERAFRAEIADVLCHVLLLAHHHQIDVKAAIEEKWLSFLTHSDGSG